MCYDIFFIIIFFMSESLMQDELSQQLEAVVNAEDRIRVIRYTPTI